MSSRSSVLIACGGTGGHLFPGIAVAQALKDRGVASLLVISEKPVDRTASQAYPDLDFLPIPGRPLPRLWSPLMVPFLIASWRAFHQCRTAILANGVGAVLGMGGFTSMMPVLAGRMAGLPVFLHDSNAIPGKANRMAARFATTFFLGLEAAAAHTGKAAVETVGTPVRDEFKSLPDRAEALRRFDLDPSRKTLLVLGGSQGARALNLATLDALGSFDPHSVQVIMLTGAGDNAATLAGIAERGLKHVVRVHAFCRDMPAAYACADIVLARAGASSLSELATVGLPCILVPYPFAADDHQTANASAYVNKGAAEMINEDRLTGTSLAAMLRNLWSHPDKLSRMAENMLACSPPAAAATMADRIAASLT